LIKKLALLINCGPFGQNVDFRAQKYGGQLPPSRNYSPATGCGYLTGFRTKFEFFIVIIFFSEILKAIMNISKKYLSLISHHQCHQMITMQLGAQILS